MVSRKAVVELLIRNRDVERVIIGTPTGHKHQRIILQLPDKRIIFEEATIANIARALVWIGNHPKVRAMEMRLQRLTEGERKRGYAEYQLLETMASEEEVQKEVDAILGGHGE